MLTKLLAKRSDDGFTLLELLIVVIVIGILAAIALPVFLTQQAAAYDASAQSDVRNTVAQVVAWNALNKNTPELTAAGYVADGGKLVTSPHSYVGLTVAADGTYTVCGYNERGNKYSAATKNWSFDSTTGKSAASTTACANAVHVRSSATDASGDSATTATTVPGVNGGDATYLAADPKGTDNTGGTGAAGGGTGTQAEFTCAKPTYPAGTLIDVQGFEVAGGEMQYVATETGQADDPHFAYVYRPSGNGDFVRNTSNYGDAHCGYGYMRTSTQNGIRWYVSGYKTATYTISGWYYINTDGAGAAPAGSKLQLTYGAYGDKTDDVATVYDKWAQFSYTITPIKGADHGYDALSFNTGTGVGSGSWNAELRLDDLSIVQK